MSAYKFMHSYESNLLPSGADPGGRFGRSPLLKPMKVTFFTMILYNLENSICDFKPFCSPLFCYSNDVKYTSSLLQWLNR